MGAIKNDIVHGSITTQLLRFFFPIWFGTFFQYFYNTADAVIIGNFVGKEALAAVGGPTGVIINLFVGLFVGLSSGATVIISQYYGARDRENTSRSVHTAAALTLAVSIALTVLGVLFAPGILHMMGTPPDVLPYAVTYLRIYFGGSVTAVIYNFGTGILRAVGDSRRPLYFLIVCSITNVALDLLFVAVFQWGVAGVALATVIAQGISAVLIVYVLLNGGELFRLHPSKIRFDFPILIKMVRIGLPAGLQSVLYSFSNAVIQSSINLFGTNAIAAWTAYGKLDGFFWMSINSFGIAITTFSGQNFGAKQYDRVKKSVRVCLLLSLGFTVVLSAIMLAFGGKLYLLFTDDADVIAIGIEMIWSMVPYYVTFIAVEILSGALRGTGDVLVPTLITCGGVCVLRLLWIAFVVPQHLSLDVICMSYPITWSAASILFALYYTFGKWLPRSIRKAEKHSA